MVTVTPRVAPVIRNDLYSTPHKYCFDGDLGKSAEVRVEVQMSLSVEREAMLSGNRHSSSFPCLGVTAQMD